MIIIRAYGGLGNQLFQWALYQKFLTLGKEVSIDKSAYDTGRERRAFYLAELDPALICCDKREKSKLANSENPFIRKLCGDKKTHVYEKQVLVYDKDILSLDQAYLEGYWQNEAYFADIRTNILDKLQLRSYAKRNAILADEIASRESVSIHVRRGDFLRFPNVYGNICTLEYYQAAIDMIGESVKNPVFYIFSDDMEWCRQQFSFLQHVVFVDYDEKRKPYEDMGLMSLCKHNIIANSSFSWWAAWLNENEEKLVIAPDKWLANHEETDIICKDWIRIEV